MEGDSINKTKVLLCTLSLSLVVPSFGASLAQAESPQEPLIEKSSPTGNEFTYEDESGVKQKVTTTENGKFNNVIIKNDKGTQKYSTDKSTGYVSVTSDYLSEDEVKETEKMVNNMAKQFDDQIPEGTTLPAKTSTTKGIGIQSVVGDYVWGGYKNITVTYEDKATETIITAAILSRIKYIGWIAAAIASLLINYNVKTGYFRVNHGVALDSHPDYVWTKERIKVYRDSERTDRLDYYESSPYKVRVY